MIIETTNTIYEVRSDESRFRRIHEFGAPNAEFPVGEWFDYQRMSDPGVGEPIEFYWMIAQKGRVARIGLCVTSPVARILPDESSSAASYVSARRRAVGWR